jgi:transposase
VDRLEQSGFASLEDSKRPGRPASLDETTRHQIGQELRRSPRELDYGQNLWDRKLLSHPLAEKHGVSPGVRQCQRLFCELNFRRRKPRPLIARTRASGMRLPKSAPDAAAGSEFANRRRARAVRRPTSHAFMAQSAPQAACPLREAGRQPCSIAGNRLRADRLSPVYNYLRIGSKSVIHYAYSNDNGVRWQDDRVGRNICSLNLPYQAVNCVSSIARDWTGNFIIPWSAWGARTQVPPATMI